MIKLIMTLLVSSMLFLCRGTDFPKYDRKNWRHWSDDDRDGFTTRQEVLLEENLSDTLKIIYIKKNDCK